MEGRWIRRRDVLAGAAIFWLSGFHFFYDGFYHMAAFWLLLAPLAVVNIDGWFDGSGTGWKRMLAGLVAWQAGCAGVARSGPGLATVAMDVVALALLVVACFSLARVSWGWRGFRVGCFAVAAVAAVWSLIRFYAPPEVTLVEDRLRNVWVYPIGLNAVLTGLLFGHGLVAGLSLAEPADGRRWFSRAAIIVLTAGVLATQSRAALLATGAGVGVLAVLRGRALWPSLAAMLVGAAAYFGAFALIGDGGLGPDLVERGSTGRFDIWQAYIERLSGTTWWAGEGRVPALNEELLGWFVHHPHSSWVAQLVWCGIPGVMLLLGFLGWSVRAAWTRRREMDGLLALLVFGVSGLVFDGAQIVSLGSVPRIEPLLVLVPAVVALAGGVPPLNRGG